MFSVDVSAMRHTNGWPLHGISLFKLCEETLPKCSQNFPGLSKTTSTEMQCKPQSPAMCSALIVRIMTTNVMKFTEISPHGSLKGGNLAKLLVHPKIQLPKVDLTMLSHSPMLHASSCTV